MPRKNDKLSTEEKEILEAYENGKLVGSSIPESMVIAAKDTMKKNKSISIRISENDLESIRLMAAKEGIPYQTLIGSLIHKYASGYL